MIFLQDHGVSTAFAAKIYRQYGNESIPKVKENPFRLADEGYVYGYHLQLSVTCRIFKTCKRCGRNRIWDIYGAGVTE